MEIKYNIRSARKSAGLSQAALAQQIGVSLSTYQRYESGAICPPLGQIEKMANACGVSAKEIFGFLTDPQPTYVSFPIWDFMAGLGYEIGADEDEGYLWIIDKRTKKAYEITETDKERLEHSLSDNARILVQQLIEHSNEIHLSSNAKKPPQP